MRINRGAWLVVAGLVGVSVSTIGLAESQYKIGDKVSMNFKVAPRDGEFRKGELPGVPGCIMEQSPSEPGYMHCLRMGPLQLGMEFYRLQMALSNLKGIPEQFITQPRLVNQTDDGITTLLMPVAAIQAGEQTRMQSYLIVVMDQRGIVKSLQLTGLPGEMQGKLKFSSIALGSSRQDVADILGFPSSVSDVPEISGKMWSYYPFPFTIEFKGDTVYSVRIHEPGASELSKAFVPLKSMPD